MTNSVMFHSISLMEREKQREIRNSEAESCERKTFDLIFSSQMRLKKKFADKNHDINPRASFSLRSLFKFLLPRKLLLVSFFSSFVYALNVYREFLSNEFSFSRKTLSSPFLSEFAHRNSTVTSLQKQ